MTAPCRAFGISRQTGYKWLARYYEDGPAGRPGALEDRPRRAMRHPNEVGSGVTQAILWLRRKYLRHLAMSPRLRFTRAPLRAHRLRSRRPAPVASQFRTHRPRTLRRDPQGQGHHPAQGQVTGVSDAPGCARVSDARGSRCCTLEDTSAALRPLAPLERAREWRRRFRGCRRARSPRAATIRRRVPRPLPPPPRCHPSPPFRLGCRARHRRGRRAGHRCRCPLPQPRLLSHALHRRGSGAPPGHCRGSRRRPPRRSVPPVPGQPPPPLSVAVTASAIAAPSAATARSTLATDTAAAATVSAAAAVP
jgi:hypothetical protein